MTFCRSDGYFGSDTRVCCIYKTFLANDLLQVSNIGGCVIGVLYCKQINDQEVLGHEFLSRFLV